MKPVIFGCAGPALSEEERDFFASEQPAGFILFARNIQSPQQVLALTSEMRSCLGRPDVLITIDQEGGRVQRMTSPHWQKYPPMALFGQCAKIDAQLAEDALAMNCTLIADDLRRVGINMDCLPLLDVPVAGCDNVIGDRAFAGDPTLVAKLGRVVVDSLMQNGVLPVIKHLPGHGRATVDSHKELPVVAEPVDLLETTDFLPFKALADCPFGMTAHIVYSALDPVNPATTSATVIERAIRESMEFKGLLMSDDLSMKALEGSMAGRASAALGAGCDMILHCNGDMAEMRDIAGVLPRSDAIFTTRLAEIADVCESGGTIDRDKLETDHAAAMKRVYEVTKG